MIDDYRREINYRGETYVRKNDDDGLLKIFTVLLLLFAALVFASTVLIVGFAVMLTWRPIASILCVLPLVIILGLVFGIVYFCGNYFEINEIAPVVFLIIAILISSVYAYYVFFDLIKEFENLEAFVVLRSIEKSRTFGQFVYYTLITLTVGISYVAAMSLLSSGGGIGDLAILFTWENMILALIGPIIAITWRLYKHPLAKIISFNGGLK